MKTRSFHLISSAVQQNAAMVLSQLPCDGTIEIIIKEFKLKRRNEANSLYWVRLAEIAEQGWIAGARFSGEAWHILFREKYLPEAYTEGITLEGYVKWVMLPDGERRMVGSTTKLTTTGFAQYLEQVTAFGAHELAVHFSEDRN